MNAATERAEPAVGGLQELVGRARRGDRSVLPELRSYLDAHPDVWSLCGDLAAQALELWVGLLAGRDLVVAESVRRKADDLRAELAGPSPSPLEALLADRVVACWVQVHHADALYAQTASQRSGPGFRGELLKRQESAQRRYLASIRQLAAVRKLLGPGLSPLDLVRRPVEEGSPAGARRAGRPAGGSGLTSTGHVDQLAGRRGRPARRSGPGCRRRLGPSGDLGSPDNRPGGLVLAARRGSLEVAEVAGGPLRGGRVVGTPVTAPGRERITGSTCRLRPPHP